LDDRKGIQPVKTSASKPLGMAVNVTGQVQPEVPCGYEEFWPMRMLRIRKNQGGNRLTQVYLENGRSFVM